MLLVHVQMTYQRQASRQSPPSLLKSWLLMMADGVIPGGLAASGMVPGDHIDDMPTPRCPAAIMPVPAARVPMVQEESKNPAISLFFIILRSSVLGNIKPKYIILKTLASKFYFLYSAAFCLLVCISEI